MLMVYCALNYMKEICVKEDHFTMIDFKVDAEKCIRCGTCVSDCPMGIIHMDDGREPYVVREEKCLECQHCLAVCPTGAVSVLGVGPEECIPMPDKSGDMSKWLKTLIAGRRSVRSYRPENVPFEMVSELLDIAYCAPTGHNDRTVHFSVVQGMDAMKLFKEHFYSDLADFLAGRSKAKDMPTVLSSWAVSRWKKGIDAIFRDAPGLLVTHAPEKASTPMEDCLIAMATFELAAQAAGLGTLWNGIAKWTIDDFCPGTKKMLGIPEDHILGYVMLYGKPSVTYRRSVVRGKAPVNWVKP